MWIENVSLANILIGNHHFEEDNTVLIRIGDICSTFKPVLYQDKFVNVYEFQFMDDDDPNWEESITEEQGVDIASILRECWACDYNVVVHCNAGLCRSGAVAEVGEIMGFQYAGNRKIPNVLVKNRILEPLYEYGFFDGKYDDGRC